MTRRLRVFAALLVAVGALGAGVVPQAPAFDRAANEQAVLQAINQARARRGLRELVLSSALQDAARSHSRDMLVHGYFGHSSPRGADIGTRARAAGYPLAGSRWAVGEVIAWGKGSRGLPQAVFSSWMHSSAHRSVILARRWRDVGVGCVRGTFRGVRGAILYTVDFGRRR